MAIPKRRPRPSTPTINETLIALADNPDITISVFGVKTSRGERSLTRFRCKKAKLIKYSEYFAASLRFNNNLGPHQVELKDDDIDAMRVWLLYLHAAKDEDEMDGDGQDKDETVEDGEAEGPNEQERLFQSNGVFDTDITRIWHMIIAADKYLLNAAILGEFFQLWYKKNVDMPNMHVDFARQLALPCYMYDYAEGFAEVTKWLAYNHGGHITEIRPKGFKWKHMHLCPPDFVGPMNHARGGLKTSLHRGLWDHVGTLLEDGEARCTCNHWDSIAGRYFAALVKIAAYPLEKHWPKNSCNAILSRLQSFPMIISKANTCCFCTINWKDKVTDAISYTSSYFDGLCIDCMKNSRPGRANPDAEYWKKLQCEGRRWDTKCRVTHGEPSWYVSCCGQGEVRQQLLQAKKMKRRID